jgi:hypothetical protein
MIQRFKITEFGKDTIGSPGSVERFRELASAFTKKATKSKASAIKVLTKEGLLTAKGNLSKRYFVK